MAPFMSGHGERIMVLTGPDAGREFVAAILPVPDIDVTFEVVEDRREKCQALFDQRSVPNVDPRDRFSDESGQIWSFGRRSDNPQDAIVTFDVDKITEQDQ
jgi:hypothetical protein